MKLEDQVLKLIAVGASIAANCQPCLQNCIALAKESGADDQAIAEAIGVGKMVLRGAAAKMDAFIGSLKQAGQSGEPWVEACRCMEQIIAVGEQGE